MKNLRGQLIIFWKFLGVKLKILKKLRTKWKFFKDYNNEEFWNSYFLGVIWNSLNLTWIKYFVDSHHFKNSLNYYLNNEIHLKVFEFPHNITFPQNIPPSKHTLKFSQSSNSSSQGNKHRFTPFTNRQPFINYNHSHIKHQSNIYSSSFHHIIMYTIHLQVMES